MIFENIWRKVDGNVLINISPVNIFLTTQQDYITIVRLCVVVVSISGLISWKMSL